MDQQGPTRKEFDDLKFIVNNHKHQQFDQTKELPFLTTTFTVVELTDASSVSTDASLGDIFTLTTTQSFTMANPTNGVNGQKIIYKIKQDGTGSRVITWGSNFRGSTDVPLPTLTTTANYVDYIGFIYDSSVTKWNCLAVNKGFAS